MKRKKILLMIRAPPEYNRTKIGFALKIILLVLAAGQRNVKNTSDPLG